MNANELIPLAKAGDKHALDELFKQLYKIGKNQAYLLNSKEWEDLLQRTIIIFFKRLSRFDLSKSSVSTYFIMLMKSEARHIFQYNKARCNKRLRGYKPKQVHHDSEAVEVPKQVSRLTEQEKEIAYLYARGCPTHKIGAVFGRSRSYGHVKLQTIRRKAKD